VHVRSDHRDPAAVEALLRGLPEWFGIESSIREYVDAAGRLPTYLGFVSGEGAERPVGCLLVRRHFPASAEIHLMAVARELHRTGIGRALVAAAEADLAADGVRWLQVKTLGPSRPDAAYAATREFYTALGFEPLEEFAELWPGNPCLLMVKAL
jgi:GNAT superfamily N-acetyltransferase